MLAPSYAINFQLTIIFKFLYMNAGELLKVQQAAHCDLILLEHDRKPRRAKSRKSQMREVVLKEAWDRLGDLPSVSQENKVKRVRTFLQSVDPFTILAPGERTISSNSNSN